MLEEKNKYKYTIEVSNEVDGVDVQEINLEPHSKYLTFPVLAVFHQKPIEGQIKSMVDFEELHGNLDNVVRNIAPLLNMREGEIYADFQEIIRSFIWVVHFAENILIQLLRNEPNYKQYLTFVVNLIEKTIHSSNIHNDFELSEKQVMRYSTAMRLYKILLEN